jgi:N-carbamoylputrescine amidase
VAAPSTFKIGLVQMRCSADPDDNLARAIAHIAGAAGQGAQIVCLPELFRSQYFCQSEDHANFDLAEPIPGRTTEALALTARQTKVTIIASLFERRAAGVYHNTAVVIDADGKLLGSYRKMHIPDDPLYYEKFYFTPGDLGFRALNTRFGRIGLLLVPRILEDKTEQQSPPVPSLQFSRGWLLAAIFVAAIFIGIFGPGVRLS